MGLVNALGAEETLFSGTRKKSNSGNQTQNLQEIFSGLVDDFAEDTIEKVRTGYDGPSFQIGADSYTEKEWNKIIETFDKMEKKMQLFSDATDTVQENIMQSTEDKKAVSKYTQVEVEILMAEYTMVTYPSENGQETKVYYTYYSYHGIYCKKEGENGFEWEIQYEDESQYNKVMDFMKNFDGQEDLFFASSQKFWEDFLDDKIDIDSFLDFWKNRMLSGIQMYFPFLDENEKMEDYFQYVEERYGNTVQKSV